MAEPWESDTVVEEEPTTPQAQPWDQDPAVEEPKAESSIVSNALAGAGDVIKGFAQQLYPKFDLKTLAGLASGPINAQIQGYNALKGIVDTAEQVHEAEKTEPFSRERFGAGLNVVGQLGLLALGARKPTLKEVALGEKAAPEAPPQTHEPTISETVPPITETIKEEVIPNASEITGPESVTQPEIRPQMGEEAPLRQQGETPTAQEVVPVETQEVEPTRQSLIDQEVHKYQQDYLDTAKRFDEHASEATDPEVKAELTKIADSHRAEAERAATPEFIKTFLEPNIKEPVPQPEQPIETGSGPVSRKEFREYLNRTHPFNEKANNKKGEGGKFGAQKRAYGDYLWHQDREMFENDYQNYLKEQTAPAPKTEGAATAQPLPKTEVASPEAPPPISPPEVKSLTPDSLPVEVGPNVKGFEEVYGPGEIKPGESITPEELFRNGKADLDSGKIDPYAIADRARTGDVSPRELGALAAEHDRLLHEAASFEGTPGYEERYQAAKTFAQNMLKPAGTKWHQTGIGLQVKAPIDLSNLTGFRAAFEARFNKEMSPAQAEPFSKMAKDVARAKAEDSIELGRTAERVQQRFKGVKDIPFEDAVKSLHEAIKTALKDCNL